MKKLVQINVVCNGSTGKIMDEISRGAMDSGFKSYCFYGRGNPGKYGEFIKFGNKLSILFHVFLTRIFNLHGHGSYFSTIKMVKKLRKINPDIIQLHNVHGYYINLKVLFKYLKHEYNGKIIWTLHDCWAFTGHCSHFTVAKCNKWKSECFDCPLKSQYPKSLLLDTSKREFNFKKKIFTGIKNLKIVVPSFWLKTLVNQSFLKEYSVNVINNGIDFSIFQNKKTGISIERYNIPKNKNVILGVSNVWNRNKGLDTFLDLSKLIDKNDIIVLVGLSKNQKMNLPNSIIGIEKTQNQNELAEIYSLATVFMNPSLEETFSLVTLEAMACGTPVIVCDTSAVKELVTDKVGIVVNKYSAKDYYNAYLELKDKKIKRQDLLDQSKKYSNEKLTNEYLKLYKEL